MARKPHDGSGDDGAKRKRRVTTPDPDPAGDDREDVEAQSAAKLPSEIFSQCRGLTLAQRRFAEAYVADPDRCAWRAAWRAGYGDSLPDLEPEPTPATVGKSRMNRLYAAGHHLRGHPKVSAYIETLEARAIEMFIEGTPEIREQMEDWKQRRVDAEALAAKSLAVITSVAHADLRSIVRWTDDEITVRDSDDLEYFEQLLVKKITHKEVTFAANGDQTCTTIVELADRAPYLKMLEARLGKIAPSKVEVSGPGGAPIETRGELALGGPSSEILDSIALKVLGVVPATKSRQEAGIPLEEIKAVLEAWSLDTDPHVTSPAALFEQDHWAETERRYLVGDGSVED